MAQSISLSSKIRLKTNTIYPNSICLLKQKKKTRIFIAHSKGVHTYDPSQQQFQQVKLDSDNSGVVSCLTKSDDLVFFCYGMRVFACGINGKTLYQSDTYLAVDKIDAIHVYGYQLWLVAGNIVNQFLVGGVQLSNKESRITTPPTRVIQDISSQVLDVKINHSLLFKVDAQKPFLMLLKANNQIQIYDKKGGASYKSDSPPTFGYVYPCQQNNNRILVGTMGGQILYLQVNRKKINKIWSITQNSKGKINCLVQVKNGFIVFRDDSLQMWNSNRQCLGKQSLNEKIYSALYYPEEQSLFYGTYSGNVVEMFDYQRMMKQAKERNQYAEKAKIIKLIEQLRKVKQELTLKAQKMGVKQQVSGSKKVQNNTNLTIDYVNLCYSLEITSDSSITRVDLKGQINLMQSKEKIAFQCSQGQNMIYVLRTQDKPSLTVRFKFEERSHTNDKLQCTVYNSKQGKLITSILPVDLKHLSLHQKVQSKLLNIQSGTQKMNMLRISGQFKYFLMTFWLSSIFNDLGSPSLEQNYIQMCYESVITKNKIYVAYKDQEAIFYSQAPTPLTIIKKTIYEKSKDKHLSLNYDSKTNLDGIANLLKKLGPKITVFEQTKKQFDLLPGLLEIQSESISAELSQILGRSEQIKAKYQQNNRQYEQIKASVKQFLANYRALNNKEVTAFQLSQLDKALVKFNANIILQLMDA